MAPHGPSWPLVEVEPSHTVPATAPISGTGPAHDYASAEARGSVHGLTEQPASRNVPGQYRGMRTAVPLPDPLAKRSFTLLESDAVGISRKRTRANDLRTVSRGIRVPVAADQPLAQRARP